MTMRRTLLTGIGIVALSTAASAQTATCNKSFSQLSQEVFSKMNLQTCGPEFQKGLEWVWKDYIVKGAQDVGKMVGDVGNAVGKSVGGTVSYFQNNTLEKVIADSQTNWNNFASGANTVKNQAGAVLTATGSNISAGWNNFMSDLQNGTAKKNFWNGYNTMAKNAQDLGNDLAHGGQKTSAIVSKNITDGMAVMDKAVGTMTQGMIMAMMESQYKSGCEQVAGYQIPGRFDAYVYLQKLDRLLIADAYAAEAEKCKKKLTGCPTTQMACTALIAGGGVVAWELASLLLPGGFMKWGLSPNALKGAAWVAKFIGSKGLLAAKGLAAGAKTLSTVALGTEKTAVITQKVMEGGHVATEIVKATGAGVHALAQTEAAQAAGKAALGTAAFTGKTLHVVGQLPGIKQFNMLQDGIVNIVLNGTEKAVTVSLAKGRIFLAGRAVAATEKNFSNLLRLNKNARVLLTANEEGRGVMKVISDEGKVLGEFPATDTKGKPVAFSDLEKTHREGFERIAAKHNATIETAAPEAHGTALSHGTQAIPGQHIVVGDEVPNVPGAHYVEDVNDVKNHGLIAKVGRIQSPGESLVNSMREINAGSGKKIAFAEKLPASAEDDVAHLFRDTPEVTIISRRGVRAADRAIIYEARQAKGLKPLEDETVYMKRLVNQERAKKKLKPLTEEEFQAKYADDEALQAKAHEEMLKEQPKDVTDEAEKLAKKKAQDISACEKCIASGEWQLCPLNKNTETLKQVLPGSHGE